ncbi:hypothetical protein [Foetidibacter luteolus]|uniref:hypothetical protein n=1 Tax=Foetidibacter luteolus TaxID=2608880 RepID=UPI00129AEE8F|nr:hypothetical protein [Foetidibacter luteolus]
MTPTFPAVSIYKKRGLSVFYNDSVFKKISTYTYLSQSPQENKFYDAAGKFWTLTYINQKVKNDFWTRFLANSFYNPTIEIKLGWTEEGVYTLGELKEKIFVCIDKDDDIITQFVEADFLKDKIYSCETFHQILTILDEHVFHNQGKRHED